MFRILAFVSVLSLAGCAHKNTESAANLREPAAAAVSAKTLFIPAVQSAQEFEDLAENSTGVIRQGKTIKIFIDNRNMNAPVVYFMNANYCPKAPCASPPPEAVSHYAFAKVQLKNFSMSESDYMANSYYTTTVKDRKFFDARVQKFHMDLDGQDQEFYGIRFIERDAITNDMLKHAVTAIAKVMKIPGQKLALIQNSQTQRVDEIQDWLNSQNIKVFTMEKILSGISFIGLNPGTATGFLRVFPENEEDLEPFDIPVFSSLPLDLSVVAGTISTEYQDVGSHVNLKSKERGTPNMVARDPQQVERLKSLNGKPVKLTVTYTDYKIEETTSEAVFAEYKRKTAGPWKAVSQVAESALVDFDAMCAKQAPAKCLEKSRSYGGKVAGLGFIAHAAVSGVGSPLQKRFGYRLSPMGYGVPLSYYNQFMKDNMAKNPKLAKLHQQLIDAEMGLNGAPPFQSAERRKVIDELKAEILKGEIPRELYAKMHAALQTLVKNVGVSYPGTQLEKLKIRSSSNAEDIEGFNGAGLHDSYSARVSLSPADDFAGADCRMEMGTDDDTGLTEEDVAPKSLACAIKATYASLWNMRAVRERSFKKFDHRTASMGLSVQIAYKFRKKIKIAANSVLVTRVLGTESVYGQQISSQVKNGLVTNPVPGTKAELAVISFDAAGRNFGINLLQFAKPEADEPALDHMIMSREQMLQISDIAREVEIKYCESKANYYPGGSCKNVTNSVKKALALDMEFKQFDNGQILIKQVRTFSGK